MAFVKLDCGILDSTLWLDKDAREIFITALLMAVPRAFDHPIQEIAVDSTEFTGYKVPAGNYGLIEAASLGIIARAGMERDVGLAAIYRLTQPEPESRSQAFGGRRFIRIDGGFLVLNYEKYRDKDQTAAERQRRWRERQKIKKDNAVTPRDEVVTERDVTLDNGVISRNVTHVDVDVEAGKPKERSTAVDHTSPFDLFWAEYPKKRKKKTALEIWKRKQLDGKAERLVADVKNRKANDERWLAGFIPDPTTYLNQERWNDELQDANGGSAAAEKEHRAEIQSLADLMDMAIEMGESFEAFEVRVHERNGRRLQRIT